MEADIAAVEVEDWQQELFSWLCYAAIVMAIILTTAAALAGHTPEAFMLLFLTAVIITNRLADYGLRRHGLYWRSVVFVGGNAISFNILLLLDGPMASFFPYSLLFLVSLAGLMRQPYTALATAVVGVASGVIFIIMGESSLMRLVGPAFLAFSVVGLIAYNNAEIISRLQWAVVASDKTRLRRDELFASEQALAHANKALAGTNKQLAVARATLEETNGELERRVAARTAELRKSEKRYRYLFTQSQTNLRRTEALYTAARALSKFDDLPRILDTIVDSVAEALSANAVSLITLDQEKREVVHFAKGGKGAARVDVVAYDELQAGLTGWALRHGQPVLSPKEIPDLREEEAVRQRRQMTGTGGVMVAPLVYRQRILGTITAMNLRQDDDFSEEDLSLLAAMADQATAAIENGRLFMEIQAHLRQLERTNAELFRLSQLKDELLVAYGRFVPHEFLNLLHKESIVDVRLGDQIEQEMTILFADVRDFTALLERMAPKESFDFVNQLLGIIGPAIRRHGGFIDKYTGDGIMALFPTTAAARRLY
jgi:GAF domain-containing protein